MSIAHRVMTPSDGEGSAPAEPPAAAVHEVTPSSAPPPTEGRQDSPGDEPEPAPLPGSPLLRQIVGLQLILLAGLAAVGYLVVDTRTILDASEAKLAQIDNLSASTAQVVEEQQALAAEVVDLRRYVASRTTEDVIFLKIMIAKPKLEHELARDIAKNVRHYAGVYRQDPDLVLAIIDIESDFDPNVVSYMGAVGLMQVMPQWKKVLGIEDDLEDIETSIKYGLQILGFYQEMYKDLDVALTAYNRGPGAVDAALMKGRDPKNLYAPRVLERYAYFKALNSPPS